jgi:hypothetical protein
MLRDDPVEFNLAWDDFEDPFIPEVRQVHPSFMDVRVELFHPPFLADRFLRN